MASLVLIFFMLILKALTLNANGPSEKNDTTLAVASDKIDQVSAENQNNVLVLGGKDTHTSNELIESKWKPSQSPHGYRVSYVRNTKKDVQKSNDSSATQTSNVVVQNVDIDKASAKVIGKGPEIVYKDGDTSSSIYSRGIKYPSQPDFTGPSGYGLTGYEGGYDPKPHYEPAFPHHHSHHYLPPQHEHYFVEPHHYAVPHHYYDKNALAAKAVLWPLAGLALLGAAAALVSNPVLLQLGVVSNAAALGKRRRRRNAADNDYNYVLYRLQ